MTADSPVLTLREAGAYLKRGRTWMLAHADEIGVIRDGGRLAFLRADLDGWLARHRTVKADVIVIPTSITTRRPSKPQRISRLTGLPFREARR